MGSIRARHTALPFALVVAVVATPTIAPAASMYGFGAAQKSCGMWLAHSSTQDASHTMMGSWIDGYLTAWNEARSTSGGNGAVGHSTDNDSRDAWVTKYCNDHPLNNLFQAAKALMDELAKTGR